MQNRLLRVPENYTRLALVWVRAPSNALTHKRYARADSSALGHKERLVVWGLSFPDTEKGGTEKENTILTCAADIKEKNEVICGAYDHLQVGCM